MSDGRANIVFVLCDNAGWGDFSSARKRMVLTNVS
jgi:hypothetical protein